MSRSRRWDAGREVTGIAGRRRSEGRADGERALIEAGSATRAGGGELAAELTFRGRLPIRGTREPAEVYTLA